MRRALILTLALFGGRAAAGQPVPHAAAVDSIFSQVDRADGPGCAVGVYRAGEVVLARGYGLADLEHGVPITPATRFNVASLSKQFTAYAVTLLEQRGQLSLDDVVRRHLPELPDVGAPVTVRHLVHHTSGLRAYEVLLMLSGWNRDHPLSRDQFWDVVGRQRTLGFAPGERHQYGNTNYALLALLVERVDGRPFADFMRDEVFAPLGMADTFVREDPLAVVPGRAEHYTRADGGFRKNYVWAFAYAAGASNVVTTVGDLARWDAHLASGRIGAVPVGPLMHRRFRLTSGDSTAYAFGLELGEYRGLRAVSHTGGGGGDYVLLRFPAQRWAAAVLCNHEGGPGAVALAYRLADLSLADAFPPEAPAAEAVRVDVPDAELTRWAGEWRDGGDERLTFLVQGGTLAFRYGSDVYETVPVGGSAFREGALTFAFEGAGDTLVVSRPGWRGVFRRWTDAPWAPTTADLAAFAGTYRSEELDADWTIRAEGDTLTLHRRAFPARLLGLDDRDVLALADPFDDMTLTSRLAFGRDAAGRVVGFRLTASRVADLAFRRLPQP